MNYLYIIWDHKPLTKCYTQKKNIPIQKIISAQLDMDQFFNNAAQRRQLGHLWWWRCGMCSFGKPGGSKMGPASLGVHHHEHILGGSWAAQGRFIRGDLQSTIWCYLFTFFLLLDPTAGWFPRAVSRSMGVLQNGLLLKLIIGQFSWGGAATKFMPTGLPICFPCIAQLGRSCIFQKNVDGDFRALVC